MVLGPNWLFRWCSKKGPLFQTLLWVSWAEPNFFWKLRSFHRTVFGIIRRNLRLLGTLALCFYLGRIWFWIWIWVCEYASKKIFMPFREWSKSSSTGSAHLSILSANISLSAYPTLLLEACVPHKPPSRWGHSHESKQTLTFHNCLVNNVQSTIAYIYTARKLLSLYYNRTPC